MDVRSYIERRHDRWLDYANYQCRISGLNIEPIEVLNETICTVLERDPVELSALLSARRDGFTELDFLVLHIIKINIRSPRSRVRYQRGAYCTDIIDLNEMPVADIPVEEIVNFDIIDHFGQVYREFDALQVPEASKQIFRWRFFDARSFAEWPGPESKKYLHQTYNRIFSIISSRIRKL